MNNNIHDDKLVVSALIANDPEMIEDFFFNRCRKALEYIGLYFCDSRQSAEELIGDFYLYMSENDWHRLRIFKFSCSLNSYISVVASRYFQSKRDARMHLYGIEPLAVTENAVEHVDSFAHQDVERLIDQMKPLDRMLVERILIDGEKPGDVLDDVRPLMDGELLRTMDRRQFAAYVYTRYSRARRKLQNQLTALGYGA